LSSFIAIAAQYFSGGGYSEIPSFRANACVGNLLGATPGGIEPPTNSLEGGRDSGVIDTLNRSLAGSESDDKDMAAYIRAADAIRHAFGCVVIIVHHCGVDATRPRGHTSLIGAVDAQLAVKRDAAGNIVVVVERMKDGPEGETIVSKLEAVDVGTDMDGDTITSCVVVPVDGATVRPETNRKLSDRQKLALDALADCTVDHGEPPPATFGLPVGLLAISVADWRDELYARGVLDRDAKSPREDFRRVKNSLQARKLIGERDGVVWRVMS
jgi:hypothetical protein